MIPKCSQQLWRYSSQSHVAASHCDGRSSKYYEVPAMIEDIQCNPLVLDTDNHTPLHRAAISGHLEAVKYLTLKKHWP